MKKVIKSHKQHLPEYTLIRSKRKTLAIYIRNGRVEVRAPQRMSRARIEDFLIIKQSWIQRQLEKSAAQLQQQKKFSLDYGDKLLYRGKSYPIVASSDGTTSFDGAYFCLPPDLGSGTIKQECIQLYRSLAQDYLQERTLAIARQMNVMPAAIKISNAQKQWGSCNSKKVIRFSWRIMMADDPVIDYLIAHELAHLLEMNHSPQFWNIVQQHLPDYKARQKRLRQLQDLLATQDWT